MKKGFTLVELLAVIVLTSLIMLIAIPALLNAVNKKRDSISDDAKKIIYDSADLYLNNYSSVIQSSTTYCIELDDLVNSGYLTSPVKDFKNDKEIPLNYFVKAVPDGYNSYTYSLDKECSGTRLDDTLTN